MSIVTVEITENTSDLNVSISESTPNLVVEVVENQILNWTAPSTFIDGGSPEAIYLISQVIDGGIVEQ
jgi:hypothetical protein